MNEMKIFKTWQKWLEFYYTKYGSFKTQTWTDSPKPWIFYGTKEYEDNLKKYGQINHREIFPDEIFIDIDADGVPNNVLKQRLDDVCEPILKKLKDEKISYTYWNSGGRGRHFSIIFPELIQYNKTQQDTIKKCFKLFLKSTENPTKGFPHICMGNPSLVQLENAKHRKGGTKTLIEWFDTKKENTLPKIVLEDFGKRKTVLKEFTTDFNLNVVPKEIQFLEQEDFSKLKDGRYRALFVLTSYYSHFLNDQDLFKKMWDWNVNRLNYHISQKHIWATIRSVRNRKDRPMFPYNYLQTLFEDLGFDSSKLK